MLDKAGAADFDPRTWLSREPLPAVQGGAAPAPRRARWPWLAGAGLCFAGALSTAWLGREHAPALVGRTASPGSSVRTPMPSLPPPPPAGAIERTATLDHKTQIGSLLAEQNLAPSVTQEIARLADSRLADAGGLTVTITLAPGTPPTLLRLRAVREDSSGLLVTPVAGAGWRAETLARAVRTQLVGGSARITGDSLYSSAVAAGLNESLLPDFAKAFSYDFDFQSEVGADDTFEMEAEQGVNAEGQAVGAPRLVFASLATQAKSLVLYRFAPAGGQPGWFDANGRSVIRSFMRTPVDGARVSSQFGIRVHPVLEKVKMHEGVDFAVPLGTPIYAAADGTVLTARLSATAGNMVELRHEKGMMTRYFHMTRFADGITPGVRVHQGQVIGLSGSTGRSTGPHLHYELRLNGEAIDPLSYKTAEGHSLAGAELLAFRRERGRIDAARAHQSL